MWTQNRTKKFEVHVVILNSCWRYFSCCITWMSCRFFSIKQIGVRKEKTQELECRWIYMMSALVQVLQEPFLKNVCCFVQIRFYRVKWILEKFVMHNLFRVYLVIAILLQHYCCEYRNRAVFIEGWLDCKCHKCDCKWFQFIWFLCIHLRIPWSWWIQKFLLPWGYIKNGRKQTTLPSISFLQNLRD